VCNYCIMNLVTFQYISKIYLIFWCEKEEDPELNPEPDPDP